MYCRCCVAASLLATSVRIASSRLLVLLCCCCCWLKPVEVLVVLLGRSGLARCLPGSGDDAHRSALMVDGRFTALPINGVGVTPLLPMALSEQRLYADAVTAVQRILPDGG